MDKKNLITYREKASRSLCVYIRPKVIIVTSNVTIEEIWSDSATVDPLIRRFKVILKESQEQAIDFD
jgi:hypothetical protein